MNIKAGYKTTEFWLAVAGAVLPIAFPRLPWSTILTVGGVVVTYVLGRSVVKAAAISKP